VSSLVKHITETKWDENEMEILKNKKDYLS
jgi:hypothetical protein